MRVAEITRTTKETDISLRLSVDGRGEAEIDTGVGFFDHMLESFAKHGRFDLKVLCKGDVHVDFHHTVEDVGIVLGQAFAQCVADKTGLRRYGAAFTPMDEALSEVCVKFPDPGFYDQASVVLDLSNRPFLVFHADFALPMIGDFPTELAEEFFRAFAMNAMVTLHINVPYGKNSHHVMEAIFKGTGRALQEASRVDGDVLLSTKGVL